MSEEDRQDQHDKSYKGVFITKRTKVLIPAGGLSIGFDENGAFTSNCILHVGVNLSPFWIKIACSHLREAEIAYKNLVEAGRKDISEKIAEYLEREFISGMQAMMAAAIALDAHYAVVKDYVNISSDVVESWKKNKTSRPKQIYEVFRRAFPTIRRSKSDVAKFIAEIFRFRDWAVHPIASADEPILYPEINRAVEWRFLAFRFLNAKRAVRSATQIIALTLREPYPDNNEQLKGFCIQFKTSFDEAILAWEDGYGELWEQDRA